MWEDFLAAIALALVLEGVLPFLSPNSWRETMRMLAEQSDQTLRKMGLGVMIFGVVLLYLVRGG